MVGPVLGLGMEAIARRLADASATMKVVATVGLVLVVQGFFSATFGTLARTFPAWLPQHTFDIGGVFIGADQMIITGIALAATVALFVFFRRTRLGLAMRGVVDNPELLDLGRTSPAAVRRWAWIIGSSFAELRGIKAGYGEHTVLRDVSLTVQPGTVVAVLGPNGAGKTTLLRVASGLLRPSAGTVILGGQDVTRARPFARARPGMCHIPEGRGIYPALTVRENLVLHARQGEEATALDRATSAFPALGGSCASRPGCCPAASSRCCRWPAPTSRTRRWSSWTKPRRASRRWSWTRSS